MRITNIKATNMDLTPAIREYVEKKIADIDRLIPDSDESAHATVEVGKTTMHHQQGDVFRAEVNLHIAGADFYAEHTDGNLYAAIDMVKDKAMREVRRHRNKQQDLARRGGSRFKRFFQSFRIGENE